MQPLLDNALRYGRSLVSVELSVNGTSALVTVGDDGAGLAADETERIFEPGVRGSAAATSRGARASASLSPAGSPARPAANLGRGGRATARCSGSRCRSPDSGLSSCEAATVSSG